MLMPCVICAFSDVLLSVWFLSIPERALIIMLRYFT